MAWAAAWALTLFISSWFVGESARAQAGTRRVTVAGSVELLVASALREAPAPSAPGLPGRVEHFFTDGAVPALVLWVQSWPASALASLPPATGASDELIEGLRSGLSGAERLRVRAYDPERGALAFEFEQRASAASGSSLSFSGCLFFAQGNSVLALFAAPAERAAELRSAAQALWQDSQVLPEGRLPIVAEGSFRIGRLVGVVLGSLLGGGALTFGLSWLLAKLGLARGLSVAISGLAVVCAGALLVVLAGTPEAALQLCSYVLAGGLCHALLPRWWKARRRRGLLADERGLSTVEYVIVLVLLAAVSIGAWRVFGDSVRGKLAGTDQQLSLVLGAAQQEAANRSETADTANGSGVFAGSGLSSATASNRPAPSAPATPGSGASASLTGGSAASRPASGSSASSSGVQRPAPGSSASASGVPRPAASGSGSGTPGGSASASLVPGGTASGSASGTAAASNPGATPAPGAATAARTSSPGVASAPAPSKPPTLVERIKESTPGQVALGVVTGALQSFIPGGFLLPSPRPKSRAFEAGRGLGQLAAGVGQVIGGSTMTGVGGAATVGGVAGAPVTGGGSLAVAAGGAVLTTEGILVTAHGATTVGAGLGTLGHAATMSSSSGSSGGGAPAPPTPAPAAGAQPPSPPPPAAKPPPPGGGSPTPPKATPPAPIPSGGVTRPTVSDPKLGNIVKDLYKGANTQKPIGTGSTADAIRFERATGQAVGGKFHTQKGQEYVRALQSWLAKNPNAPAADRSAAQSMLNDLLASLSGK